MQNFVDEPIAVLVAFANGRAKPWKFRHGKRMYDVKHVNLIHGAHEGTTRIFYFNVSDDEHAWKMRFNAETLEWRLVETYTP